MSWIPCLPEMRIPNNFNYYNIHSVWREPETGLFCFYDVLQHVYKIATQRYLCPTVKIDGVEATPIYNNINGFLAYECNGWYLYYAYNMGMVLTQALGSIPLEYWDYVDNVYRGDNFYQSEGSTVYYGRGALRGSVENALSSNTKSVEPNAAFNGWTSETQLGQYSPSGNASGYKYFGLPQWKDQQGVLYTRSLAKTSEKYTYGSIEYNIAVSKWVIGSPGSESGWWEGSEPSKTAGVTFTFKKNEDSSATGVNLAISFNAYIIGDNTTAVLAAQVPHCI